MNVLDEREKMEDRRMRVNKLLYEVEELLEGGLSAEDESLVRIHSLVGEYEDDDYLDQHDQLEEVAGSPVEVPETTTTRTSQDEDLFSLQVFVEKVEIGQLEEQVDQENVAVAFRLMDFPTLVIYPKKESMMEFQAGKSCLFRIGLREVVYQLRQAPLYLMLLKTNQQQDDDQAILLGSTSMDLSGLCGLDGAELSDIVLPSPDSLWGWRRGRFPVYDLMGNRVAVVIARIRLCNFGDGILPHLLSETPDDLETIGNKNCEYDIEETTTRVRLESRLPVPVELLQTMKKLEAKLERLEVNMNHKTRAKHTIATRTRTKTKTQNTDQNIEPQEPSWLPRPGQGEGCGLPPAMYFKQTDDASVYSDNEESDEDDIIERETLPVGPPPLASQSHIHRPPVIVNDEVKVDKRRKPQTSSRDGALSMSSLTEKRITSNGNNQNSHVEPSGTRPVTIKVRKTRAQILRERANQRRYKSSSFVKEENPAEQVGFVQLTADLGRSRVLSEKDMEERKHILKKREERHVRDSGKMKLSNLLSQSHLSHASEDQVRTEQLERMWKGQMPLQAAFEHQTVDEQKPVHDLEQDLEAVKPPVRAQRSTSTSSQMTKSNPNATFRDFVIMDFPPEHELQVDGRYKNNS